MQTIEEQAWTAVLHEDWDQVDAELSKLKLNELFRLSNQVKLFERAVSAKLWERKGKEGTP